MKDFQEAFSERIMACSDRNEQIRAGENDVPEILPSGREGRSKGGEGGAIFTTIEREFLDDVVQRGSSTTKERYCRLGVSAYKGNRLKNSLLHKNLVSEKIIPLRNSRVKMLELTKKGRELLGVDEKRQDIKTGSVEREFWKERVARHLRARSYEVREEYPIGGGKAVDLIPVKAGEEIGVEIETGKSDPAANIEKCVAAGFRRLWVLFTNRRAKDTFLTKWMRPSTDKPADVRIEWVAELIPDSGASMRL